MAGCSAESLKIKNAFVNWLSITCFKTLQPHQRKTFRILEKLILKKVKLICHLEFNKTCLINKLLPTYTNLNLHDGAAKEEEFVLDFRKNLIERQSEEQENEITIVENQIAEAHVSLEETVQSPIKRQALMIFLERTKHATEKETKEKQHRKLCQLYGGNIFVKQTKDSIVNLSARTISKDLQEIFTMGFNFHLKSKYDILNRKAQIEKLFEDIKSKERNNIVEIEDESLLKTDLERFGMKQHHSNKAPLSKHQMNLIKEFNRDETTIVRKADKSNVFVLLDKEHYINGINSILADDTKFAKVNKDPTEDLKKEINKLISEMNEETEGEQRLQKLAGQYEPGYIYANPKIHKDLKNPPYRPIISQIGTVTHDIAKMINSIIVKYLPKRYQADSTYEFLSVLRNCPQVGMLASLDAESLFTNVPVADTIDIILKNTYEHNTMEPPKISRSTMERLLKICTTRTPFRSVSGEVFVQCEGVSMGSALGPTFANFYMCDLENRVFALNPALKPYLYVRYVDDICLVAENFNSLLKIKHAFELNSVLKFTFEIETKKSMPFLDVLIDRNSNSFTTSVFVKQTNHGDCINYNSICPERYKTGVIKSMLHRAFHLSSSWQEFSGEVERLKQLLTNNNFPMAVIDSVISRFVDSKVKSSEEQNEAETKKNVSFYFLNQMSENYKQDEKQLQDIFNKNVSPISNDSHVQLIIYYKSRKLKDLFIKNNVHSNKEFGDRHHCVYQYVCPRDGCNSAQSYIGHTTCSLTSRFRFHTQNSSSIKKHFKNVHAVDKIKTAELLQNVTILKTSATKRDLIFLEALLIKTNRPSMNSQVEFSERVLKVFKH